MPAGLQRPGRFVGPAAVGRGFYGGRRDTMGKDVQVRRPDLRRPGRKNRMITDFEVVEEATFFLSGKTLVFTRACDIMKKGGARRTFFKLDGR
ncbi:MAG: hypothetical protein GX085_07970 [Firmicutes bacterium]|nr:hypothetical protein [Bacillota bacterium]